VGGRGFEESRFNRVTQARRQPGSAFKPFVYAAALEQGFTPATVLTGLSEPIADAGRVWLPADGHVDEDSLTMRAALRVSSNRAAVRMLEDVGITEVVDYAERFGWTGMPRVPSLALGSGEVTMLSLVSAYGAFANRGELVPPSLIRRVTTSSGEVLFESKPAAQQVVDPATAFLITSMLEDVVDRGTAAQVRGLGFRLPAAGKTGTTNDYRDAWFIGYTPRLVTGVWVGYDKPRTIVQNGYAAQLAVPLWTRFMIAATRNESAQAFRAPRSISAVEICPLSGKRATDACRRDASVYTEHFADGTEPDEWCPYHSRLAASPVTLVTGAAPAATPAPAQAPMPAPVVASSPQPASQGASEVATVAASEPPAPKKRGFWARVFGVGADKEDQKKKREN
jgi:penicillin-binding protein 1A